MSISGTNQATDSVPFGAVVATGDATSNGTAGTPARSDHVHKGVVAADAWTSYTPTLTQSATVTKTVTYAKYIQLGKTVTVSVSLAVTGAGTSSNAVAIGLPVTAANGASNVPCGIGWVFDTSAPDTIVGQAYLASTTTAQLVSTRATGNIVGTGGGFSAALASGDIVTLSVTYEAA